MPERPHRLRIQTELGHMQSLSSGTATVLKMPGPGDVLLLGLGPTPASLTDFFPAGRAVYVIEAPEFKSQMPDSWLEEIPEHWKFVSADDLSDAQIRAAHIIIYRPALRFFPSFWGKILGRSRWLKCQTSGHIEPRRYAILPGSESDLLVHEISDALDRLSFRVRRVLPSQCPAILPRLLQSEQPELFLSVNFRGLDKYGELFHLLQAAGIKVAVWCVDNPFHQICGLRSPFWKELTLFVTDETFVPLLRLHGAQNVHHLPLGAWPEHCIPQAESSTDYALENRLVFVGRSEFPHKKEFFAGCSMSSELHQEGLAKLEQGERPDFEWSAARCQAWPMWPGPEVRRAGYVAEMLNMDYRIACLQCNAHNKLTVFGNPEWTDLVPDLSDLRKPVDYYSALPGIYKQAGWCLNMTSLLLPRGLTQRHFDVWISGGFLITDNTPGLHIFPEALTQDIRFSSPSDIPAIMKRFPPESTARDDLRLEWVNLLLTEHTYVHRVGEIMNVMGVCL